MQLRRLAPGLVLPLCFLLAAVAEAVPPAFVAPPDDLSSLTGDGWRALVEPDGSFVFQSGRRYVADVGLRFTSRPKNEVTMQNYDGEAEPGFPALDGTGGLLFVGGVKEKESKRAVHLRQTLTPLDAGLAARYGVTVDEAVPLNRLSMWITLPI